MRYFLDETDEYISAAEYDGDAEWYESAKNYHEVFPVPGPLPKVTAEDDGPNYADYVYTTYTIDNNKNYQFGFSNGDDAELDRIITSLVAIREYRKAHPYKPPVDEAQVKALGNDLHNLSEDADYDAPAFAASDADIIARALIARGWTRP